MAKRGRKPKNQELQHSEVEPVMSAVALNDHVEADNDEMDEQDVLDKLNAK